MVSVLESLVSNRGNRPRRKALDHSGRDDQRGEDVEKANRLRMGKESTSCCNANHDGHDYRIRPARLKETFEERPLSRSDTRSRTVSFRIVRFDARKQVDMRSIRLAFVDLTNDARSLVRTVHRYKRSTKNHNAPDTELDELCGQNRSQLLPRCFCQRIPIKNLGLFQIPRIIFRN